MIKLFKEYNSYNLKDLIEDHFTEILDINGSELVEETGIIVLYVPINEMDLNKIKNIDDYINYHKEEHKIGTIIKRCLNRLIQEQSHISYQMDWDENVMILLFNDTKTIKGDYYEISLKQKNNDKKIVKIDIDKLRNILKLPSNVSISIGTTGIYDIINFDFNNTEDLNEYKDDLILNFKKLKIEGDELNSSVRDKFYHLNSNYKQTYYNRGHEFRKTINEIQFYINQKYRLSYTLI